MLYYVRYLRLVRDAVFISAQKLCWILGKALLSTF